jgi:endonuclease YncB( thermonuclease family)
MNLRGCSLALAIACTAMPFGSADAQCRLPESGAARAAGFPDGRSLVLQDGREIVLAGIEPAPDRPQAPAALARLIGEKPLILRGVSQQPDRYGRHTAFVFVSGAETPVQYDLLREGAVRAGGAVEGAECQAELLREERTARAAKVGLWSDPVYDILRADNAAEIGDRRGRFAVVEGLVLSVRESGGTIYVNFGRRWSEDFTATIPRRLEARFAAAGVTPRSLAGRTIRVRGFVEERGGPWIEILRPNQIELAETRE